jgi:uncharacterized membrane protein YccC
MRIAPRQILFALLLGVACLVTWWASNVQFYGHVDADTALLGSMWAVIATIFVLRESHAKSLSAGLVRILATVSSVILCSLYFLLLPFSPIGLAALVALSYLIANAFDRPDDAMTAGITITVVMVVGALNPENAWLEPLLRLVDTLIGAAVAIAAAFLGRFLWSEDDASADSDQKS